MPIRRQSPSRNGSSNSHRSLPQMKKKKSTRKAKSASHTSNSAAGEKQMEVTVLSPAAMENLYYIAHSAVDALEVRGFGWEGERPRKKKKGKTGKKK